MTQLEQPLSVQEARTPDGAAPDGAVPVQTVRDAGSGLTLGRDVIFRYLRNAKIDRIFGVPGTNEIPLIDGTDVPANNITYVPCLHENIALGAAMGYARAKDVPGVVELHVTPGVGHALGNLFNAAKSHIPLVVLCGQQHSNLLLQEPLLASDLVKVAEQYTKWSYEVRGPNELAMAMQRALKVAMAPPTGPVFLSIPWEFLIRPVQPTDGGDGRFTRIGRGFLGDMAEVAKLAEILAGATSPVIVAGDGVGAAHAWDEVEKLAKKLGAPVYTEQLSSYMNYPNDRAEWQGELPGTQEGMRAKLGMHDVAFFCGFNAQAQLVVFDWATGPLIPKGVRQLYLHNDPWQIGKNHYGEAAVLGDIKVTLPRILEKITRHKAFDEDRARKRGEELKRLADTRTRRFEEYGRRAERADDVIHGSDIARALRDLQRGRGAQDGAAIGRMVLVNEAVSDSAALQQYVRFDAPTDYFEAQGGSLGFSMPAALGIHLALDDAATVVNIVGDGSALFYPHSWWTAAKFEMPILYIITNNHRYQTLIKGMEVIEATYGWKPSGPADYLRIEPPPELDFVRMAQSFGVERGARVSLRSALAGELREALRVVRGEGVPYVLEVMTEPEPEEMPRIDVLYAERGGDEDPFDWIGPA
ncbi:thiamine pyrophosphate-binding protein [Saccharothrix sp. NRRL B-16314]|uniref:thiamine pyrophosphate-binding protein n=1 Tax=Saccharothrix sp. NRRL B-16314 TaxID=1463825 RepID=UPI002F35A2D1